MRNDLSQDASAQHAKLVSMNADMNWEGHRQAGCPLLRAPPDLQLSQYAQVSSQQIVSSRVQLRDVGMQAFKHVKGSACW